MAKLALGTAQFGLDYGINNARGKIPPEEAHRILDAAHVGGIDTLDTALVYGDSEKVLGDYLRGNGGRFRIISKTKGYVEAAVRASLKSSLEILGINKLYAYLLHDFDAFVKNPSLWRTMEALKNSESIDKAGFSLYRPSELAWILDHRVPADIIQIPLSVFDRRFLPLLSRARQSGIEIHVRSVFLQGLAFKDPESLDHRFAGIKERLNDLRALSARTGISLTRLCLGSVSLNQLVDRVVVGIDGLAQLEELMSLEGVPGDILEELARFGVYDERVLLPFRWSEKE